jgi:hypothetical protein
VRLREQAFADPLDPEPFTRRPMSVRGQPLPWQRGLRRGQYFVFAAGATSPTYYYGVVEGVAPDQEVRIRCYDPQHPFGTPMMIGRESVRFPLSGAQFGVARQHNWPQNPQEVRTIVNWCSGGDT